MQGKTHAAVGTAAALAAVFPVDYKEFTVVLAFGLMGAMISDIDVGSSRQHRQANAVIAIVTILIFSVIFSDYYWNLGICSRIVEDRGWLRIIGGVFLFTLTCAYGKEQPHRSFAHSILGLALFDLSIWMVIPFAVKPFTAGFLSHLALDLLNKKGVRIWYPLKKGHSLGAARADGAVNYLLFAFGTVAAILEAICFIS